MRAYPIIVFVIVTTLSSIAQDRDDAVNVYRLNTAIEWLTKLGVESAESVRDHNLPKLCSALQKWQGPTGKLPAECSAIPTSVGPTTLIGELLMPSLPARLARVPQFKAEFLQTSDYVYGIPEGSPSSVTPSIFPNPDHGLLSLGGALDFSELLPSVETKLTYCTALEGLTEKSAKPDPRCMDWRYLKEPGFTGWLKRYAAATQINVTVSQIPKFESGILIVPTSPAAGLNWTETVTGSISPSALFLSSSEEKKLADYYHNLKTKPPTSPLPSICTSSPTPESPTPDCIKYLAAGSKLQRTLLAILPRIDVKAFTAFDFSKTGTNSFIALPDSNKALYDFTLTWDLRNTIPSIQMRSDAISAFQQAQSKHDNKGTSDGKADAAIAVSNPKDNVAEKFAALASDNTLVNDQNWWDSLRDDLLTYALANQNSAKQ